MTGAARTTLGKMTQGGAGGKRRRPLRVGRQTNLTPEVSKRICDAVRAGNYVSVAARYCGVAEDTLHDWVMRGRGEHPTRSAGAVYVQFARDLDAAEAGAEVAAVLHWRAAMPKDWHSSEKWLKVRQPERWAEKTPDQIAGAAYAGVQVNIGVGGQATATPSGPQGLQVPLASLLEDHPELIAGTMQFLDEILPLGDGTSPSTTENAAQPITNGQYPPTETIYEAEPGSWSQLTTESAPDGPLTATGGIDDA